MIATSDAQGTPNVAPVYSVIAIDEENLGFAEISIQRTRDNLLKMKKASVLVLKTPTAAYQLKGVFMGFQTSGPIFDKLAKIIMDSLKLKIKSAGVIKVEEIYSAIPGEDSKKIA
jgi:predicted pyridoxine 5'-phosphate oxidase superfamily flavin-nucleotide-binding protein